MSLTVTPTATGRGSTMIVDATVTPCAAVAVGPGRAAGPPARAAGDAADDVAALVAPLIDDDAPPPSAVVVVAADTGRERFVALADAVDRAGLPAPTWIPDAVARAGALLATGDAGVPYLVVDARTDDTGVWAVRPTASVGRVGSVRPVEVGGGVEDLLVGIVRAKLDASSARRPAVDPDASGWGRDLRVAARRLAADRSGHGRLVVSVDEVEVSIHGRELAEALAHASRSGVAELLGPEARTAPAVVVTDTGDGFAGHLASAFGATVVRGGGALAGTAALLGATAEPGPAPTPPAPTSPAPTSGWTAPSEDDTIRLVVPPLVGRPTADPPRWVVPALTSLVAAALVAAGATLLSGVTEPGRPVPAVVGVPADVAPGPLLSR